MSLVAVNAVGVKVVEVSPGMEHLPVMLGSQPAFLCSRELKGVGLKCQQHFMEWETEQPGRSVNLVTFNPPTI